MNINRHNYEEYFILYLDNELDPAQRRAVEDFVQLHPDLKEELDTLLQYKLVPDNTVVFPAKEDLLKGTDYSPVNASNYPEWLLLYTDNELNAEQRVFVEQFVHTNPDAKKELDLLLRCRLEPEAVRFTHKESLYRREEKVRSLPVWWWRAAAAVILLAAGLTVVLVNSGKHSAENPGLARQGEKNTPAPEKITRDKQHTPEVNTPVIAEQPVNNTNEKPEALSPETVTARRKNETAPLILKEKGNAVAEVNNKTVVPLNKPVENPGNLTIKKEEPMLTDNNNKPSNNLPQPLNNPNLSKPDNTVKDALAVNNNTLPDHSNPVTKPDVTNPAVQPSDIVNASYKTTDADFGQEGKEGKKSKLRGLFRKVARTFEKRTNINPATDDNKLLVAGWSINLK